MPLNIAVTVLLIAAGAIGMRLGRVDGIILIVVFILFLYGTVRSAKKTAEDTPPNEDIKDFSWPKCIALLAGGAAAVAVGGQLVVDSAEEIALSFGLSETLIGLTICAIGTSLPELVTSMTAVKKGEDDMAVGNVIGSCLFNILLILGLTSAIRPIGVSFENITDLIILLAICFMMVIMAMPKKQINRPCGACCLAVYAVYMVYICIR